MQFPDELLYSTGHEWILVENGMGKVGITDYAEQMLGDVVYVEMPEIGTEVTKGEAFGVVESVKAASDIYAPVSGEVTGINEDLGEHPEHINRSPYELGWIIKVKISNKADLDDLMDSKQYQEYILKETDE
jgi:glycine cleavage system H protein